MSTIINKRISQPSPRLFRSCACLILYTACNVASALTLHMNTAPLMQEGLGKTCVIAGATGYIGKAVVQESVRQGYRTIALVRDKARLEEEEGKRLYGSFFEGAEIVQCDVEKKEEVIQVCSLSMSMLVLDRIGTATCVDIIIMIHNNAYKCVETHCV